MGIKSVDLFRSYPSHRNQVVHVNVTEFDLFNDPLFLPFSLLNDIELNISPESKFLIYADESAILHSHK